MEAQETPKPARAAAALDNPLLGALLFGIGAAITAGTYFLAAPGGTYLAATGFLVGGALQFLRGLWTLLMREPAGGGAGQWPWAVSASGVMAVAVVGLLLVGASEYLGVREEEAWASWQAAIEQHDRLHDESDTILEAFFERDYLSGQDIVDAYRVAELYERAAAALESAEPVPTGVAPHRTRVADLEREFAAAFRAFAEAAGREAEDEIRRYLERTQVLDAEIGSAIDAYNAWLDEQDRPKDE
jgi:hypothetical protein